MTTNTITHTPTPWYFDANYNHYSRAVIRHNGCIIATFPEIGDTHDKQVIKANATHIVRCVNEREELLRLLARIMPFLALHQALSDEVREVLARAEREEG